MFGFEGLRRVRADEAEAATPPVAGFEDVQIGDTRRIRNAAALARIVVEQPTIKMMFRVNDHRSRDCGKWVTSRHVRERLERESKRNIALRVDMTDEPDVFEVSGRGELMLAILAETMRREG